MGHRGRRPSALVTFLALQARPHAMPNRMQRLIRLFHSGAVSATPLRHWQHIRLDKAWASMKTTTWPRHWEGVSETMEPGAPQGYLRMLSHALHSPLRHHIEGRWLTARGLHRRVYTEQHRAPHLQYVSRVYSESEHLSKHRFSHTTLEVTFGIHTASGCQESLTTP